jgi:hypothetical protein
MMWTATGITVAVHIIDFVLDEELADVIHIESSALRVSVKELTWP